VRRNTRSVTGNDLGRGWRTFPVDIKTSPARWGASRMGLRYAFRRMNHDFLLRKSVEYEKKTLETHIDSAVKSTPRWQDFLIGRYFAHFGYSNRYFGKAAPRPQNRWSSVGSTNAM